MGNNPPSDGVDSEGRESDSGLLINQLGLGHNRKRGAALERKRENAGGSPSKKRREKAAVKGFEHEVIVNGGNGLGSTAEESSGLESEEETYRERAALQVYDSASSSDMDDSAISIDMEKAPDVLPKGSMKELSLEDFDDIDFDQWAFDEVEGTNSTEPNKALRPWKASLQTDEKEVLSRNLLIEQDLTKKDCRVYRTFPADRFMWIEIPEDHVKQGSQYIRRWLDLEVYHDMRTTNGPHRGFTSSTDKSLGSKARFTFLCSSESRLKDNRQICFFAPYWDSRIERMVEHADVLGAFGDLMAVYLKDGMGKYLARLSLSWSDTVATITLTENQVVFIPDSYTGEGPDAKAYTDGCGIITQGAAEEVQQSPGLRLDYCPSAWQVRFGGCKGMLAVWSDRDIQRAVGKYYRKEAYIYLRESQVKYRADHLRVLEINDYSSPRFRSARLQRSLVRLLVGCGTSIEYIKTLVDNDLARYKELIGTVEGMEAWLEEMGADLRIAATDGKTRVLSMLAAGYDINEPYIVSETNALRRNSLIRYMEKLGISVPESRMLFGIIDETGTLEEDEITAYVSTVGYLEGKVVIARSPLSHPGDIRVMKAIKPIKGGHLQKDCLIFPRVGAQPVPDQLSGGDLDGDEYFVSWDPKLVPPMTFAPNPRPKVPGTLSGEDRSTASFLPDLKLQVKKALLDFEVGKTTIAWEECEEICAEGAHDSNALLLSARIEQALDAAKHNYSLPKMPSKLPAGERRDVGPVKIVRSHIKYSCREIDFDSCNPIKQKSTGPDPDLLYHRKQDAPSISDAPGLFDLIRSELKFPGETVRSPYRGAVDGKTQDMPKEERKRAWSMDEAKIKELRAHHFPADYDVEDVPRYMELASRLYATGYRYSEDLDNVRLSVAWLGAPFLDEMKAHAVASRSGVHTRPTVPRAATTKVLTSRRFS